MTALLFDSIRNFLASSSRQKQVLTWCTVNSFEQKRCEQWAWAVEMFPNQKFDLPPFQFNLACKQVSDKKQCMNIISNEKADLVTLDPGEIFIAGRHHSLVPIVSELYGPSYEKGYYSVAVIKSYSNIRNLKDLKDKKVCFSGVGHLGGWIVPMSKLVNESILEVKDCNNMVKNAANFFNSSCAPNALIDKYNPSGDNPQKMCALCKSKCLGSEEYANYNGAFKCLSEVGDVAFLQHTTVQIMNHLLRSNSSRYYVSHQFELLCPQGGTALIDKYHSCNWGFVPSHAVVVSSSASPKLRQDIQNFILQSVRVYGRTRTSAYDGSLYSSTGDMSQQFQLFKSDSADGSNLFLDDTTNLVPIPERNQTFSDYLGQDMRYFEALHECNVPTARLCVISKPEFYKCLQMAIAFKAQMLKPKLACYLGKSSIDCMKAIRDKKADLTVLDAGDVYKAGSNFGLIPIVAEKYDLNDTSYYVVAVAKQSDPETDLFFLKGKTSCHTGYGTAAGWVIPLSFFLSNNRMRSYGCDSLLAASQYFQKSCVPGAMSNLAENSWKYSNLCHLCHGEASHYCSKDHSEPFFGHTGALRCLVEGGGQVAFVKHTTILENTGSRNFAFWSRNKISNDFELLCRDGSRAKFDQYQKCNIGRAAANAIVTAKNKPKKHIEAYINLFLIAQQFYGSQYSQDYTFKMFVSDPAYHDLIFNSATSQLIGLDEPNRDFRKYLGQEFISSIKLIDCSHSNHLKSSPFLIFSISILFFSQL